MVRVQWKRQWYQCIHPQWTLKIRHSSSPDYGHKFSSQDSTKDHCYIAVDKDLHTFKGQSKTSRHQQTQRKNWVSLVSTSCRVYGPLICVWWEHRQCTVNYTKQTPTLPSWGTLCTAVFRELTCRRLRVTYLPHSRWSKTERCRFISNLKHLLLSQFLCLSLCLCLCLSSE